MNTSFKFVHTYSINSTYLFTIVIIIRCILLFRIVKKKLQYCVRNKPKKVNQSAIIIIVTICSDIFEATRQ